MADLVVAVAQMKVPLVLQDWAEQAQQARHDRAMMAVLDTLEVRTQQVAEAEPGQWATMPLLAGTPVQVALAYKAVLLAQQLTTPVAVAVPATNGQTGFCPEQAAKAGVVQV